MSQDVAIFLGSVTLLIGYLIFSAKTEMGTKWSSQAEDDQKQGSKNPADKNRF